MYDFTWTCKSHCKLEGEELFAWWAEELSLIRRGCVRKMKPDNLEGERKDKKNSYRFVAAMPMALPWKSNEGFRGFSDFELLYAAPMASLMKIEKWKVGELGWRAWVERLCQTLCYIQYYILINNQWLWNFSLHCDRADIVFMLRLGPKLRENWCLVQSLWLP